MSNASVHAFFIGRVLAESIGSAVEKTLTTTLSEVGKFDAEQREALRKFATDVLEKAAAAEAGSVPDGVGTTATTDDAEDLQEVIDNLRAETAQLRAELQKYRSNQ